MLHLKMNVPFVLGKHLNYPSNLPILGPLQSHLRNDSHAAFLLLKILSVRFFQPKMLTRIKKLGAGQFGDVYWCKLLGQDVAAKQLGGRDIHDRSVPFDIFNEILILDKVCRPCFFFFFHFFFFFYCIIT